MSNREKTDFTSIYKIEKFQSLINKLTLGLNLSNKDKTYILTCSLFFIDYYSKDKRRTTYLEFAYYLILRYSIHYNDYSPLYDFSTNFGFYPISKFILDNNLIENSNIEDFFIDKNLESFNNGEYIETLEQNMTKSAFLKDDSNELSFIAPTSYGKSSIIIDYLSNISKATPIKVGIIVPKKSLLVQTYKLIKRGNLGRKILIHDEMFSDENSFIAIFTQERALRLLKKVPGISFDILFIDEAHNIFENDSRSILLSRLISKNLKLNPNSKIIYLSPLISESNNLKVNENQNISAHKIQFNIKEPELFEYRDNNEIYKHNRFFIGDNFQGYKIGEGRNPFDYILESGSKKNFLYHRTPVKIEHIAKHITTKITEKYGIDTNISSEITELINVLEKEVHKDFYGIDTLKSGVVYLHGKIPDLIKEYLELKFKEIKELKYLIANSVILEGINLPIDSLYILHTFGLTGMDLVNLIGRVNRLNEVFSSSMKDLIKLLPKIHFVHSDFEDTRCKQFNKIKLLRNKVFDEVKNPTLKEFNIEKITNVSQKKKVELIRENEILLNTETLDEKNELKKYLIENGINDFYDDLYFEKALDLIFLNIKIEKYGIKTGNKLRILDKIHYIFINGFGKMNNQQYTSYIADYEVKRLFHLATRDYYEYYIDISLKLSLNDRINSTYEYFKTKANLNDERERKFYFGKSYGEVVYDSINYPNSSNKVYIDVRGKSDKELINLAIVKIKLEEDFISFKLNKLIVFLYDFNLITREEYNTYVYGTNDLNIISYINNGLNPSLSKRLQNDNQLINVYIDINGNLEGNEDFNIYKNNANDFYKFELSRFIS